MILCGEVSALFVVKVRIPGKRKEYYQSAGEMWSSHEQKYFDRGGHGKPWLQIQSSSWAIQRVANGVKIAHTIRWKSSLNPEMYWKFMERPANKAVSYYLLTELNSLTLPVNGEVIQHGVRHA